MPDPFTEAFDPARLARHEQLLGIWRGLSAEELLADLNILSQYVAFAVRREQILLRAKAAVEAGGTHDCGEWLDQAHRCQLCGRDVGYRHV